MKRQTIPTSLAGLCLLLVPAAALAQQRPADGPAQTVIDSDQLTMQGTDDYNEFTFSGRVRAEGRDMLLLADDLVVHARRARNAEGAVGEFGSIQTIVATGNVEIRQAGRVAYAGRAEVRPDEGLVVLSDSPRIVDERATVEGWQIVYNSETKTVQVLPDPAQQGRDGQRSRVILAESAIPQLDYEHIRQPEAAPQAPDPQPQPANR